MAAGCADCGAGPPPSAEASLPALWASAANGVDLGAIPPATSLAGPPATRSAPARAAVGTAVAQPVAERLEPLKRPTNFSGGVQTLLGGAFSFMCVVRMDGFDHWSRVFDFSLEADDDSITAGAIGATLDLHFTVFRGKRPFSVRVVDFFVLDQECTLLCTVSASGHMKVFKDGVLVGEKTDGMAPLHVNRPRMIVGGHYLFNDQYFRGSLKDVKVWNHEVPWEAPSAPKAPVHLPGKALPEQADAPPGSELDGGFRGARGAVGPTGGGAELSGPEAEALLSRGAPVKGSGGVPLATA
mmetsp:Transcript_84941/g.240552  ORF Transcript_84941/g.240552 Transcript_84941/m.240552 type:complete len:298 (-) Transcript_84941:125-1018(-)